MTTSESLLFSKEFQLFLLYTQTHSLRGAAEQCGLSVSSASRQLSDLERSLHVTLFDRSCKPMVLTSEGRWFLDQLRPSLSNLNRIVEDLRSHAHFKPSLRIGFIDSFSYDVAPVFLDRIKDLVQNVSCLTGGADRLVERLNVQEVEVILTINPCFDIPDLRRHLLLREPSMLIFPKDSRWLAAGRLSWQGLGLCGLPIIRNYSVSGGGKLESVHFTTHDLHMHCRVHSDSIGMRLKMVSQGQGWSIVRPLSLLQHLELVEHLYLFETPSPPIWRNVYVLARPSVTQAMFRSIIEVLYDILYREVIPKAKKVVPASIASQIELFNWHEQSDV